ncbi:LysM repeat protein [Flavobacterium endophyticum]|uniref:LysM repeat protein n=1 Tax=Flavobacterium endophyticum TaxID=1540163 RepID=A0A495MIP0_9FLAO|nr:LysM peptidoglycan-binding domain-containing protein [Flavobacterium endophyticum]RKS25270.1 LysM repeat protein [Flavobacterium endophyticum]
MKQFFIVFVWMFLVSFSGQAQQNVKHTVSSGETVTQIAQKYKVTPLDIYTLNPDARNGLKEKSVLLIPSKGEVKIPVKEQKVVETPSVQKKGNTHTVAPKETAYGLAKQYNVSVADLEKANPEIKDGLKIGQVLTIPGKQQETPKQETKPSKKEERKAEKKAEKEEKKEAKNGGQNIVHEVQPKETKYSIAKKYGITLEELEKKNPEAKEGLKIGQVLVIKGSAPKIEIAEKKSETPKQETPKQETAEAGFGKYEVKPKETLYSLSRQFGLSQNDLTDLNPELKDGVKVGMILKVPNTLPLANASSKNFTDLTKSLSTKERKELVLLLPFNVSKIEGDTTSSVQARLKKDNFLNMTLDFYSGALVAIDSAKTLGLNIDVKILDSQENRNSSSISSTFVQNNLTKADVVVGPFYQAHAEKTAEMLNKSNVPVISPLSKDSGKLYSNLYQSMPTVDYLKSAMFDYMNSKNGNIIAVVDPKKASTRKYISDNYSNVKFASFTDKGGLSPESLKSLLVKNQMNYVVMETASIWMIKSTISALLAAQSEYQLQLVILESNDALDSDEISIANLAKLRMLYPAVTRDNDTPEALIFSKVYKKKNNIFPNQYATRGFDVTFDAMLRLSQEKSFEETIYDAATEQVENKFNYNRNPSGGYSNKGVYILYYDEDLTVKEAK